MRNIFQQELAELGEDLHAMATKVTEAIRLAGEALREADLQKAQAVMDADDAIDAYEDAIESLCLSVLARQSPVATDLRMVISAMRLSATLERMGDLARHVASMARSQYPGKVASGALFELLSNMTLAATEAAENLLELLENHDLALADRIRAKDVILDDELRRSFELFADADQKFERHEIVDGVLLSRFLERIGDHCVSGANRISYLVTGDLDSSVTTEGSSSD